MANIVITFSSDEIVDIEDFQRRFESYLTYSEALEDDVTDTVMVAEVSDEAAKVIGGYMTASKPEDEV